MEECCHGRWKSLKWIILGLVLILVRLYTAWDIWVVLGVLVLIKGILVLVMPCKCDSKMGKKK